MASWIFLDFEVNELLIVTFYDESFVLVIVHHNQLKSSNINKRSARNTILCILALSPVILDFFRHLRFEARSEVAQERFSNSVV